MQKMNKLFVSPNKISKKYNRAPVTLRRWAEQGKIESIVTPTGRYLYNINQIDQILGQEECPQKRKRICYARVSSTKQKKDLQSQVDEFKQQYPDHEIIEDIGSGLNFKRPGFKKLLDQICDGLVSEIVIMSEDRLCGFGYEFIGQLCDKFQTKLSIHSKNNPEHSSDEDELSKDLFSIISAFVAKNNGRRFVENKIRKTKAIPPGNVSDNTNPPSSSTE